MYFLLFFMLLFFTSVYWCSYSIYLFTCDLFFSLGCFIFFSSPKCSYCLIFIIYLFIYYRYFSPIFCVLYRIFHFFYLFIKFANKNLHEEYHLLPSSLPFIFLSPKVIDFRVRYLFIYCHDISFFLSVEKLPKYWIIPRQIFPMTQTFPRHRFPPSYRRPERRVEKISPL